MFAQDTSFRLYEARLLACELHRRVLVNHIHCKLTLGSFGRFMIILCGYVQHHQGHQVSSNMGFKKKNRWCEKCWVHLKSVGFLDISLIQSHSNPCRTRFFWGFHCSSETLNSSVFTPSVQWMVNPCKVAILHSVGVDEVATCKE